MSYSKKKIIALEREINKNTPLFALPISRLIKQCKSQGVRIKISQKLKIDKFVYIKDETDIFCSFYVAEANNGVLTSIVNLKFIGEGPLFEKIKKFQDWDGIIN